MEEAARSLGASELTVFRRIVLPNILPGILSGVALAFARAVGEIGAIVLICGQPPVQDRGRRRCSCSTRSRAATRPARRPSRSCCSLISFVLLLAIGGIRCAGDEARTCLGVGSALRAVALGLSLVVLLGPLAMVFWRTFEHGSTPLWRSLSDPNTVHAFKLTLIITAIAVPLNTVFGIVCALAIVRQRFPGKGIVNAFVDLPLALSPVVVGLALFLLYGRDGWFGGVARAPRHPDAVRAAVDGARDDLRLAAVRRPRGRADAARDRRRAGAGRAHARRAPAGRRSGASRCRRSAGP